ncbi:unnamed protein product (macronuclear) [Paramecium tetraurelia]|uniref:Uncharacterized protein n=1 Tax=Paramecium tetraurelia TaxID=5888 RepID=A0E3Y4_PARTE|nr:uncharacterized protein GSPATT00023174001 [Paramecium tetraurelia]CAK90001.1 unnamed protein product [Paramecium tetraurelia]|eukprot:XP_001457398.1 hypothetical protein (macronuclear) [Paramecium tetraurelia strain d4-2]
MYYFIDIAQIKRCVKNFWNKRIKKRDQIQELQKQEEKVIIGNGKSYQCKMIVIKNAV